MTTQAQRARLPLLAALVALASCGSDADVVLYCSLDQVHSEALIERFEQETGLTVDVRFDVEANKTVGLVQAIRAESDNTRCDVFWNNEIAHTVALAEEGLLAGYRPTTADAIPANLRDPQDRWTGFAARARVLIVNTELVGEEERAALGANDDLFDPAWAGRCGLARPLTGTTMTHFAALFTLYGEEAALDFARRVKDANASGQLALTKGNAHVMRLVAAGEMAWGWTDTDDFNVSREKGDPVAMVVPGQHDGGPGVMLIPNTVCILKDAPHMDAAKTLVDWILREETEAELARGRSAQIPVRPGIERPAHVLDVGSVKVMDVDFVDVGRSMQERGEKLKELFLE